MSGRLPFPICELSPSLPPDDGSWVEAWLSGPRFSRYMNAAGGHRDKALQLYEWNTTLTAAVLHDLAHVEVAIRNAYDAALIRSWDGAQHWLLDPNGPVNTPIRWRGSSPSPNASRGTR
jgi:hypothetical protein